MFNCLKIFLALFVAVAGVSAQTIWNGTADTSWYNSSQNEFTITTAEQLAGFAQLVNGEYYNMHGITITLGNNIMLNDTTDWQNWATTAPANSWTPIGNYNNPFYGKFDGAGYVIGGVYINNSNNYQGLFGYVSDGTIRNLGVVASYVKGNSSVGGLAGYNEENSSVSNCYATGNVTGNNSVGGLTGNNNNNNTGNNNNYGTINCYATGNVTGNSSVGGLVGRSTNASSVSNCYATGNVTGNSSVGGLAGSVGYNNITNCYYDSQTSGQNDQGKGIGLTTTEMKSQTFVNKLNSWIITDNNLSGWVYRAGNYPTFSNARPSGNIADYFADGDGTQSRPYIIQTPEQLELFSVFVDGGKTFEGEYIKLGANIMLNDTTDWQSWETIAPANSWTPIGNYYNPFYGTFDGAGYVIGGVYINNSNDYQGLFGANKGTIRNLGVVASYVKTIQSNSYAGGLAGHNDGSIKNCYATGNVSGNRYVGGLVGDNFYGTITNCYATGNVSGNTVGGLTGGNYGTIKNCYATGNVSGDIVGGLTGYKWGSIINCYYDKETSGQSDEGKGVGLTTTEMKSQTFADNLNDWAIFNNLSGANKWVYTPNNYPTLSNRATIADYFANGDGTQSYIIQTPKQLENLSFLVNSGYNFQGEYIKLGDNIMLNDTTEWQNWATTAPANSWTPIGNYNNNNFFSGTFDGAGYVIGGVYINSSNDYQGLFGYVRNGTIRNLGVVASYVKGNNYVGGLTGDNIFGNITNCYATGNVSGNNAVGGLAGWSSNGSSVSNCYATGNVTGTGNYVYVGGLTGYNLGIIINCYYDKETSGQNDQGKGVGLTTTEMKSQTLINKLNFGVIADNNLNGWVYTAGNYPTFSNARPSGNIADYFAGGDGTQSRPYIIQTPEQLEHFSVFVNTGKTFKGEYVKLGANIVLNDTTDWQNWETTAPANFWTPIGNNNNHFRGTFDGAGYVVSGVYINSSNDYQGLFGYVRNGTIRNLGVVASYVKGHECVGGLVGYNEGGTIKNCYATGNVSGTSNNYDDTGGLVGTNNKNGTITNCYATGSVSGFEYVGGLTGYNEGTIIRCYYDKETSGQNDEGKGVGLTTTEMKSQTFVNKLNFGVIADNNLSGWGYTAGNYPTFSNARPSEIVADYFAGGDGTQNNPYIIRTPEQLENFSSLTNIITTFKKQYIKLGANIMLNDTTNWQNWAATAPARTWTAIGTQFSNSRFQGTFDGAGYTVSGVYINNTSNYQGLFGYVRDATIKNLGVVASFVKGNNSVGGLVGYNYMSSNITNCYYTGNVSGNNYVGGLVGDNFSGTITTGTITNCYATGNVSGNNYVGGLTGDNNGAIINCYYDKETSGQNDQGKGIGLTTTEMKSQTFVNKLNSGIITDNNLSGWGYRAGNYPTFSNARPSGNIADYFAGGDGTQSRPYIIQTPEQLEYFSAFVNGGKTFKGEYIKLGNDIMLNDTTNWQSWETTAPAKSWTPIGNYIRTSVNNNYNHFYGTFDGAGYVIGGVYINNSNDDQGLFGYVSDGTIRNLGVVASYVKGNSYVGGLAGWSTNASSVSNCYATGNVSGNSYVGGLTGYNSYTIKNCYATGNVSGNSSVGGLAGYNSGTISNCYYDKETSGQSDEGKGVGLTTTEMKSQTFADNLNDWAIFNSLSEADKWVYTPNNYPNLSSRSIIADSFANGDGTQNNPYVIQTRKQLEYFSAFVNGGKTFEGEYIKLGNDIMLNDTTDWQNWAITAPANSWTPIGNYISINSINYKPFRGTFDGAGYVIGGVYINNSNDYQGLFGYVSDGTIRNLGVVASYVKGNSSVGGLVGYNSAGNITNCYATGNVSGEAYQVGGLAGNNLGNISNCYATGNVTGNSSVGGLVGWSTNASSVSNCYATGNVTGNSSVGGLAGSVGYNNITNCYYDSQTSGQNDQGKGVGLTTTEMKSQTFVNKLNFGVIADNNLSGWGYTAGNYPTFSNARPSGNIADYFAGGDGTQSRPYIIQTPQQLEHFSVFVDGGKTFEGEYIKLGANIMLNDTTDWQNWATIAPANSWTPIGNYYNPFYGTFDGAGYVIGGVYINNSNDYQGLFRVNEGTIRNLGVVASYVKGHEYVGGLVGYNRAGNITNCYATGNVSGEAYQVGGLAGHNDGSIKNCYATGNVTGNTYVGGLVGWSSYGSSVSNCYATGNVTGNRYVGGLAGTGSYNNITNCYYDSQTRGQNDYYYGGITKTTAEMKRQATYIEWDFEDIWGIDEDKDYPYLWAFFISVSNISGVTSSAKYGEPVTLSATVEPSNASNKTIIWDGADIEVGADGKITFKKSGQVTIRATITNGLGQGSDYTQDFVITAEAPTPIREIKKSDNRFGIKFAKNIVSDKAEMSVVLPNNERVAELNIAVYDNAGNTVFAAEQSGAKTEWNLTNRAGRNVANGSYLVIAEAKGVSGKVYMYSAKVGVKR